jgi:hypothetical protein
VPDTILPASGAGRHHLIHYATIAALLLLQQVTGTLSTRAKASGSLWYVGWTAALSHAAWLTSSGLAVWRISERMTHGGPWVFDAAWYVAWASLGNVAAVWIAKRYIER